MIKRTHLNLKNIKDIIILEYCLPVGARNVWVSPCVCRHAVRVLTWSSWSRSEVWTSRRAPCRPARWRCVTSPGQSESARARRLVRDWPRRPPSTSRCPHSDRCPISRYLSHDTTTAYLVVWHNGSVVRRTIEVTLRWFRLSLQSFLTCSSTQKPQLWINLCGCRHFLCTW